MENTHIYCEVCSSVQPMVIELRDGDDASGRFMGASDIFCATCGLIIATTFSPKRTGADALRRIIEPEYRGG
jgi:hypothetical protein